MASGSEPGAIHLSRQQPATDCRPHTGQDKGPPAINFTPPTPRFLTAQTAVTAASTTFNPAARSRPQHKFQTHDSRVRWLIPDERKT
jgi:hypothetical protein